ncbi:MAG TPA: hypothetical protein VJZ71_16040 [Phycisphaerae bacterium]|nr:hypothetical protein [Phycisphaerae bacterium]
MQSTVRRTRMGILILCLLAIPILGNTSCPQDLDATVLRITIEGDGTVEPCCTSLHRRGDVVRLTATPAVSWVFTSWRGNAGVGQTTNPVLDVLMDRDKDIIARFDVRPPNPLDLKAIVPADGAEMPNEGAKAASP